MEDLQYKMSQSQQKVITIESIKSKKEKTMTEADDRMKHLKALIAQARHKSDTVRVLDYNYC